MKSDFKAIFVLAISLFFFCNIECSPQGRATIFTVDLNSSNGNVMEKLFSALQELFRLINHEPTKTTTQIIDSTDQATTSATTREPAQAPLEKLIRKHFTRLI